MEFKDGDIVRLRSGGPNMTVAFTATIEEYKGYNLVTDDCDYEDVVFCVWFDGGLNRHGTFFPATLVYINS